MGGFTRFLVKRSITIVVVLFSTLVLTVALLGPTMDQILNNQVKDFVNEQLTQSKIKFSTPEQRQQWIDQQISTQRSLIGLDEPWYGPKRFTNTVLKVMALDLGKSFALKSDHGSFNVKDIIMERVPKTLMLFTSSTLIVTAIGLFLGAFSASKAGTVLDRFNSAWAVFSSSFPTWWVGMLMIFVFAFVLNIFPAIARPDVSSADPSYTTNLLYHMILPLVTIVLVGFGAWAYFVRYFVIGTLGEDFIAAKRAAGIPNRRILYSHALKNAAPPILTSVALSLAGSFGGAILIEAVFGWPGIGTLFYEAIGYNDIPVIIGVTYVSTLIFVAAVFITDLAFAYFDPRVKAL